MLYPYCAFPLWYLEHSRDRILLIVLLWFNIMDYSNLFQYFLSMCYGPYSSWKFQIFSCTCLTFFVNNFIMTGEPTHTTSEMVPRAPAISIIVWKVKYPLRFVVSYVQPVTQHFESRTFPEAPLKSTHTKRNGAVPQFY